MCLSFFFFGVNFLKKKKPIYGSQRVYNKFYFYFCKKKLHFFEVCHFFPSLSHHPEMFNPTIFFLWKFIYVNNLCANVSAFNGIHFDIDFTIGIVRCSNLGRKPPTNHYARNGPTDNFISFFYDYHSNFFFLSWNIENV